ncbi:MAG: hypothetical protein ACI4WG_02500 [Erysipelotrichaceae bacterium]
MERKPIRIMIDVKLIVIVLSFLTLVLLANKDLVVLDGSDVAAKDDAVVSTSIESISTRIFSFENVFVESNEKVYFTEKTTLKNKPNDNAKDVKTVVKYDSATLIGTNDFKYWKIKYNNVIYYVDKDCITSDSQKIYDLKNATYNTSWTGTVLNARLGTVIGPSGKETYYNLDMSGVLAIMRRMGNNDIYWIRDDGVKMLGDYVMVAANLHLRPRGSLVECSLGMGIVCDTGGFAVSNPTQLDIAVNW